MHVYAVWEASEYHIWTDKGLFFESGGKKAKLTDDCTDCFDVAVGETVYILCQSKTGDLVLYSKADEGWVKRIVLQSKNEKPSAFGIRIMENEDGLHLIYGLTHNKNKLIVHQSLPSGKPQVVMQSHSEKLFVRRDNSGCIYALCEVLPNTWHMCNFRYGAWSAPEQIAEECEIKDFLCKGYKDFCFVYQREGRIIFENGSDSFEVSGNNPSVIYSGEYKVITEDKGRIVYTGKKGSGKLIGGGRPINFFVRLKDGAEWAVCDRCTGEIVRGGVRLYLMDGIPRPRPASSLELMKHIVSLEAKVAELEHKINLYKPQ